MNPNTRVTVHGYSGDQGQVTSAMPVYLHHECPLTIFSPVDAKIEIPGVDCRFAGLRAYTGQRSLDRQREQMKMLLEYPEDKFLMHDSDSVCLSPKIPVYLYTEDTFWSNLVIDNIKGRENGYYMNGFPRLAFQPPYFLHRATLEKMVRSVEGGNIPANPTLPFIDHYMVQLAVHAGVPYKNFTDGFTAPISSDANSFKMAWRGANRGTVMIHSVKSPAFWQPLMRARELYLAGKVEGPPDTPPLMHWSAEQSQERGRQEAQERRIAAGRSHGNPIGQRRMTQLRQGRGVKA